MALLKSDLAGIAQNGNSLASLIVGNQARQQQAQQEAQLGVNKAQAEIPTDVAKANAMLAPQAAAQQQKQDIQSEGLKNLLKGMPQGTTASMDGANLAPPDPFNMAMKQNAMTDRQNALKSKETGDIEQDFAKLTPYKPADVSALNAMESAIRGNNSISYGQLQNEFGKLAGSGVRVTEQDVARVLPKTLAQQARGIGAYLGMGGGVANDMLTPQQKAAALDLINSKRSEAQRSLDAAASEVRKRGAMRAPTLNQTGQLQPTIDTLGLSQRAAVSGAPQQAPASPMSFEEFKRRKAAGQL